MRSTCAGSILTIPSLFLRLRLFGPMVQKRKAFGPHWRIKVSVSLARVAPTYIIRMFASTPFTSLSCSTEIDERSGKR